METAMSRAEHEEEIARHNARKAWHSANKEIALTMAAAAKVVLLVLTIIGAAYKTYTEIIT
jgi:ribonuclease BN (tRNA processing enzyme)